MTQTGVLSMQISAAISVVLSALVMIRIVRLKLFNKVFLKIIFFISFSDFFKSLTLVFGGHPSHSRLCSLQGVASNYFELASFFWSAAIAYEVHLVVFSGYVLTDLRWIARFCWLFPLLPTLLPLIFTSYSNDDQIPGWCYISASSEHGSVLQFFGFFLYLGLVFLYLLYVLCAVSYKLFVAHGGRSHTDGVRVVQRIAGYPVVLVVCWSAITALEFGESFGWHWHQLIDPNGAIGVTVLYVLPSLQGALTACAFLILNYDLSKKAFPSHTAAPKPGTPSLCLSPRDDSQNKSQLYSDRSDSRAPEDDWWTQTESDSKSFGEMSSLWRQSLLTYHTHNPHSHYKRSSLNQASNRPTEERSAKSYSDSEATIELSTLSTSTGRRDTLAEEERREKDDDPQAMESGYAQEKETITSINPLFGSCQDNSLEPPRDDEMNDIDIC